MGLVLKMKIKKGYSIRISQKKKDGMGLGLAIVHSINLLSIMRIYVEDNLPEGSRFIIEIPILST